MHVLGKILTWLVVISAVGAMVLTARMIEVRNSWTKKVEDLKQVNTEKAEEILSKRAEIRRLRADLSRTMLGWDKYWNNVDGGPLNKAEGTISANIGTNQGVRAAIKEEGKERDAAVLYCFQVSADGSIYVGAFQVTTLRENQMALKLSAKARAGETDAWQAGKYRFRGMIPSTYTAQFSAQRKELAIADELLAKKQQDLAIQNQVVQTADEHLKSRLRQLLGDDQDPNAKGLVNQIGEAEEDRNQALADVDRLRRELLEATNDLNKLIAENNELVKTLPRPRVDVTAKVSKK